MVLVNGKVWQLYKIKANDIEQCHPMKLSGMIERSISVLSNMADIGGY